MITCLDTLSFMVYQINNVTAIARFLKLFTVLEFCPTTTVVCVYFCLQNEALFKQIIRILTTYVFIVVLLVIGFRFSLS